MANNRTVNKPFKPTQEQRVEAIKWLNRGFNVDVVRQKIFNFDGLPISKQTFLDAFEAEIQDACIENLADAMDCLAKAARTDPNMASRYINTRGRGYFKKKFTLDQTKSFRDQIKQIKQAALDGEITSEEMVNWIQVIETEVKLILDKIIEYLKPKVSKEVMQEILEIRDASPQQPSS